ncbi:MAG: PilZ domain-containing protein [Desulfobaccales bacterium]
MEKRKHHRTPKLLPLKFKPGEPHPEEECPECPGFLKDISLGGIYFKCKEPPTFAPGHIIDFNIDTANDTSLVEKTNHFYFQGRGKVIRIDPPGPNSSFYGVAVEFLTPLDMSRFVRSGQP